ncbi:MAG: hypothetical protein A3B86_03430 [Candidatus Yanofskybacteria bacterium RIFCSPHIGHO2_02_FULL_38_22b]|uniref:Baseplate protein J-like domain-containing protein n=1 Tax=Candidatus Yanofskybacteria bacterium RIFCSPHIGHO2_02_FULL_38_22b TaxID=1802673 RepID=A0A1F8F015_9BACT|nr:MAG: hypothetical protein A3B86_03430 [Candidatus Yanofskybacteria bacterium RIFCSPHIGHO2_02_FULL_38_22b]OGN19437.1 MAG: hypothetical protein A2910_02810 [Candidatus Yanofskybacteria bacterium RIFCSPLOWO2_01_FULL_39_28]
MSTKIINILKDDRFEEILDIFKKALADEVIFVLPKRHQALANETDFEILSAMSQEYNRSVLILSPNPTIKNLALQYNFGVLSGKNREDKIEPKPLPAPESEEGESDDSGQDDTSEEESKLEDEGGSSTAFEQFQRDVINSSDPEIELAAMKRQTKSISDIVELPKNDGIKVNISKKSEPILNIEVKRKEKKALDEIESVWQSRPAEKFLAPKRTFSKKPLSFHRPGFNIDFKNKTLTLFAVAVVIIFTIVIYVSVGSAKVIVKPVVNELNLNLKITVSDQFSNVNWESRRIPGQLFSIEKRLEESFTSTGLRDVAQKARGKITVYNEYGTAPQVLVATTRFESSGGLVFRTLKTITVSGMTVRNGEITPGKIEVEIIADKAGELYNVGSGRFGIMAFKERGDTGRYEKYYGISDEQMKGGIVGQAKVVTSEDYINATKQVSDKLISVTKNELETQSAGLKIITESKPVLKELTSSAQPDEAADSFSVTQIAELETVGFKESDLNNLISQYVSNIDNLTVLPEKLKFEFNNISLNKETKVLEFSVIVQGPAYSKIDSDKIISDLVNKNEEEITSYLTSVDGIDSARVLLSPFWVTKVPKNKEKVRFEIQYE